MTKLGRFLDRFLADESGAALIEYVILVGLIAVVSIVVIGLVGQKIAGIFSAVNSALATISVST